MREKNIMMENGQPLSEELLKIPAEQFEMIERAEEIVDADFRTESVSYGKDVLRRFLHDKVTVVAAVIVSLIVLMGIAGPYMSGRSYLAQDRTRTNMPPPDSRDREAGHSGWDPGDDHPEVQPGGVSALYQKELW